MRYFLAIQLPIEVRRHLRAMQLMIAGRLDPLRKIVSWNPIDNFHLTLKFLGEVDEAQVPALRRLPEPRAAIAPFSMRIGGPLLLPPYGHIRVISANVLGEVARARSLAEALDADCGAIGIAREVRPWLAHVTIGRVRRRLERCQMPDAEPGPTFVVNSMALMSSELRPAGPVYGLIAEFPFTQSPAK